MTVLLMRAEASLQSWGTESVAGERASGQEPSFSGIVGLMAAALGRDREEPILDLAALRMGARVDREGSPVRDFHTADGGQTGRRGAKGEMVTSVRWYIADASFLVGVEGDPDLLAQVDEALARPVWAPCLGRRCCIPAVPVRVGLREGALEEVLRAEPWRGDADGRPESLRLVMTSGPGQGALRRADVPLFFAPGRRRFGLRYVRESWVAVPCI